MKKEILIIIDYKNHLLSKYDAIPYRSGLVLDKVVEALALHGFSSIIQSVSEVNEQLLSDRQFYKDMFVIYTSSEDLGLHYKSYIEDIIFALEGVGARPLPSFEYMKAHENKVSMTFLLSKYLPKSSILDTKVLCPCTEGHTDTTRVIKLPNGSMSRGVFLSKGIKGKYRILKASFSGFSLKDFLRPYKHNGYKRESLFRKPLVSQEFVSELTHDWKVIVLGERVFVFRRPVRKNDFRASGSGNRNYLYGLEASPTDSLLSFANDVFKSFNGPNISLDIIESSKGFKVIEAQFLHFGTVGISRSKEFFVIDADSSSWISQRNENTVEEHLVQSYVSYINKHVR